MKALSLSKFILFVTIGLCLMSCVVSKQNRTPYDGTWKLTQKTGGLSGQKNEIGEVQIEIKNGKITQYKEGKKESGNKFRIEQGKSIYSSEPADLIFIESQFKKNIILDGEVLMMRDECFDCSTYKYIRVK